MASTYRLSLDGTSHAVEVREADGVYTVVIDGEPLVADFRQINTSLISLLLDYHSFEVVAVEQPDGYDVVIGNQHFEVLVERSDQPRAAAARGVPGVGGAGEVEVRSPMTGVVAEVVVEPGTTVNAGQVLVIVESMKMNNELRAPRDGTVASVNVHTGDRVERNTVLATLR